MRRLSSFDERGNLSVFPKEKDTKFNLYEVTNNAITTLKHSITPAARYLIVENTDNFPDNGILRISQNKGEAELIYYGKKITGQFHHLQRGFAGYKTYSWGVGSIVSLPVMAEHYNVLVDAIKNIQKKIGIDHTEENTLKNMLKTLEDKWIAPKANFKAYPKIGNSPLTVSFHNFSTGNNVKFLWDFGDDTTSTEKNPTKIYTSLGKFAVRLHTLTDTNAQGYTEKSDYIEITNENPPFFYISPSEGNTDTTFEFVDQTNMDIIERHWFLGEKDFTIQNPNVHTLKYKFNSPGKKDISLIIRTKDGRTLKTSGSVNVA